MKSGEDRLLEDIAKEDVKKCSWHARYLTDAQLSEAYDLSMEGSQYHIHGCNTCDGYATSCVFNTEYSKVSLE